MLTDNAHRVINFDILIIQLPTVFQKQQLMQHIFHPGKLFLNFVVLNKQQKLLTQMKHLRDLQQLVKQKVIVRVLNDIDIETHPLLHVEPVVLDKLLKVEIIDILDDVLGAGFVLDTRDTWQAVDVLYVGEVPLLYYRVCGYLQDDGEGCWDWLRGGQLIVFED
jgi:hypothetical protein